MGKRKYFTEEEKKAAKLESSRKWREKNPDHRKQYYIVNKEKELDKMKQYCQEHKDELKEYKKQYYNENKEKISKKEKKYYIENKEEILAKNEQYRKNNKEKLREYSKTPMGRASSLISSYRTNDKKYNRGECTLTAQWIVNNIFSKPCNYCGENDWRKIGCDRIDNSKPHTPDNVVPCCWDCNNKRKNKLFKEFCEEMGIKTPPTLIE